MTRVELTKRIAQVEDDLMYEECADRGYRFAVVAELKAELDKLNKMLAELN